MPALSSHGLTALCLCQLLRRHRKAPTARLQKSLLLESRGCVGASTSSSVN